MSQAAEDKDNICHTIGCILLWSPALENSHCFILSDPVKTLIIPNDAYNKQIKFIEPFDKDFKTTLWDF